MNNTSMNNTSMNNTSMNNTSMNNMMNNLTNCEIENLLEMNNIDNRNNKNDEEEKCPECGAESSNFVEDFAKGMILCKCGQVIEDTIIDNGMEKRHYDDDNEPARCSVVHNRLLPQSSLGTQINAKGKLRKLQIWNAMPYKERSNNIMFKRIHAVCVSYTISKKIESDAQILCKRISDTVHKTGKNKGKPIITRGFNRSGIVAGCLFIACRRNDETRSTKEISAYFDIDEKDVNKGIRSLLVILDDDTIVKDIGTSKVIHFIQRKCDELHIKVQHTKIAMTIANNIDKLNIASNHTTYSLAAASILLMAEMNGIKNITKKHLSKSFYGLSDVTIGKTYKQIKDLKTILIDDEKVEEICKEIQRQRNKRVISQEVWDQMVRFGVDTSKYVLKKQRNNDDLNSDNELSDLDEEFPTDNNNKNINADDEEIESSYYNDSSDKNNNDSDENEDDNE
jgi:transcription initiation factor TFIIB